MRIQHNIMAMNAYRNYNNNTSALSKNLEKLSSGYKINRAGDDAAGLAISEKMRAQITGLNAAQKNVKDGISLVKTAEGAMQEIQDMLNRMDYLATQSANGTYDNEVDRANLQKEVVNLKKEINRIADSANFNGIKLLDGSLETKTTVSNIGDGKYAITKDFLVDESQDGKEPTAATAAEYKVTLAGLDTTKAASITGTTKAGGNTVTAAGADVAAKFETDSVTSTAAGDIKVTVNYKDADGQDQTKVLDVTTSNTTAATAAGEIAAAINADADLKDLFTASVTNTDKITLEAKTAGSGNGSVASIAIANGTTGQASLGTTDPTVTVAADKGSYDLSGWGNTADTITVNGKEYKQADYNAFADLKAALEADGLEVNGNADGTNVTIMGAQVTSKIGGQAITGGTTTIADLGTTQIDGKNIKDHFNVKIGNTTVTDWTATDKIAAGATITFTAKIPGKQSSNVENAFKAGTNGLENATAVIKEGIDEDQGAAATKTKYELTLNFDNLAGNQRIKVGDKTYELSTSGALSDPATKNTLVDLRGMDPKTAEGKLAIANAVHTAISTGLGADFNSTAPTAADVNGTSVKLTFEAATAGAASNKGNIEVYDNPAAISGTYTAGKDAAAADKARPTKVSYEINLDKLVVGDKITIGDKSIEIVEDAKADPANGKLTLANAKNANKLIEAFYSQGYQQKLAITGTAGTDQRLVITAAQQTAGGGTGSDNTKKTAAQFAAGDAKVSFVTKTAVTTTTTTGKPLTLQIGDTSDDFNQMEVSIGDMHVNAMFGLQRDADGNLVKDAAGNTIQTGDTIDTIDIGTQDGAKAAVNVIKDAINYVSSIRGDLGAIQNRLDHTANNLSVMAENIQDAESTIRDTDVAEEMMSYVKNNILVQSAQAMLAQANQVPQGVLQLLG